MKTNYNRNLAIVMIASLLVLCFAKTSIIYNPLASDTSNSQNNRYLNYEKENWWLTNLELLTDAITGFSLDPDMVIDSDNNIHVVWEDHTNDLLSSGADTDIFYKLYDATTETWSAEELVSSESTDHSREPSLDVDSSGNIHVCWRDITDYQSSGTDDDVFYKMRSPIGVWSTTTVLSTLSTDYVDDVDLTVDSNDNIHVVYDDPTDILGAGTDEDIFYIWFNDSLALWTTAYLVSTESTSDSVRSSIAVNPVTNEPYIVWHDGTDLLGAGTDADIFCKSYNHSISSFSTITLVSTESTSSSYSPNIAFNSKGVPHVVWYDLTNNLQGSGPDNDIFYKYLNTITNEWIGLELISSDSYGAVGAPQCAIDKEDRVYVLWMDYSDILGAGTDTDLFMKFKAPTTTIWSATKLVTEESTNLILLPTLDVDNEGFVSFVYYDYTDILGAGIDADLFHKKFIGTPNDPVLSAVFPNPSSDGNISLSWVNNPHISSYSLYRSTSPFTASALGSMVPIATLSSNTYTDLLNVSGVFYYGVVAHNEYGDSGLSNIESVQFLEDGDRFFGFLSSLGALEILTIVGAIVLSQIIISVLVFAIANSISKGGKSKGKSKKKK